MDSDTLQSLAFIAIVAVLAPIIADALPFRLPGVVLEIIGGIVIGTQVLDLASSTPVIESLSEIGLCFLFLMAGYEIDFARVRGRPMRLALWGWGISLVFGLVTAGILVVEDLAISALLVGLAVTTTAIGTLLPMLRDAGEIETPFGPYVLAAGAVGEFLPIVAIAVLLTSDNPATTIVLLIAFVALVAVAAAVALHPTPPKVLALMRRHLDSSAQLPVRIVVLLVIVLVWIANDLGLDVLLGAFSAGIIVRLLNTGDDAPRVTTKIEAVGYGFMIPIFFIVSGIDFDLDSLLDDASTLARLPLFLGMFLLARGVPALLLYRRELDRRDRVALGLFSATALPLVVAITQIGLDTGRMQPNNAAALVGAGILSVTFLPLIAFRLRRRGADDAADTTNAPTAVDDPNDV